jgi:hypothetical protein
MAAPRTPANARKIHRLSPAGSGEGPRFQFFAIGGRGVLYLPPRTADLIPKLCAWRTVEQAGRLKDSEPWGLFHSMLTGTGPLPPLPQASGYFYHERKAETGPRLGNVVGKGQLSPVDFLPEV